MKKIHFLVGAAMVVLLVHKIRAQESHLSGSHKFYINELYSYDPLLAGIRVNAGSPVLNSKNQGTLYLNRDVAANTKIQSKINGIQFSIATFLQSGLVGIGTETPIEKLEVDGNIQIGYNQFLKGKRQDGTPGNLIGYGLIEGGHHVMAISEYSSAPSEVRIYTPTDAYQGVSIYGSQRLVFFRNDGNVGIGTDSPSNKLDVAGTIRAEEVKVETGWADYVFHEDYELKSLSEVSTYIQENHHLPGIPTAQEVAENGIKLGEMNAKLLEKIEELTLYLIEHQEQILNQNDHIKKLQEEVESLKSNLK